MNDVTTDVKKVDNFFSIQFYYKQTSKENLFLEVSKNYRDVELHFNTNEDIETCLKLYATSPHEGKITVKINAITSEQQLKDIIVNSYNLCNNSK